MPDIARTQDKLLWTQRELTALRAERDALAQRARRAEDERDRAGDVLHEVKQLARKHERTLLGRQILAACERGIRG